jgi:hypothetical protein
MNKLPKSPLVTLLTGLLCCTLLSQQAQAAPINGTIDFAGSAMFDSTDLSAAMRVAQWRDVFGNAGFSNVSSTSGDFSGIALGTQATMATPWIFNPSTPTPGLWSVGGFTYDLLSATVVSQSTTELHITGTGIVSGNGFEPTQATWDFMVQNAGGTHDFFSFSGETVAAGSNGVPDSGSAIVFLGIALAAVEHLRRKVRSS